MALQQCGAIYFFLKKKYAVGLTIRKKRRNFIVVVSV